MRPVTAVIVKRLRQGLMSRNRHYRFFLRPEAREALRIHRFLRSVERDLLRLRRVEDGRVRVRQQDGQPAVVLTLEIPRLRALRTCALSRTEYGLLLENPDVRAILADRAG